MNVSEVVNVEAHMPNIHASGGKRNISNVGYIFSSVVLREKKYNP